MARLTRFEVECMERQARGKAAWGAYAAYRRQENLTDKIRRLRSQLRSKLCSEKEIKEKIEDLIKKESTGGLYIGG